MLGRPSFCLNLNLNPDGVSSGVLRTTDLDSGPPHFAQSSFSRVRAQVARSVRALPRDRGADTRMVQIGRSWKLGGKCGEGGGDGFAASHPAKVQKNNKKTVRMENHFRITDLSISTWPALAACQV